MTKPEYTEEYFGTWTAKEHFVHEVIADVRESLGYGEPILTSPLVDSQGNVYKFQLFRLSLPGRKQRNWAWVLYDLDSDGYVRDWVGAGTLTQTQEDRPVEEELAAILPLAQHLGLYRRILRLLRANLGPLLSDWTLSASALAAWRGAGGVVVRSGEYPRMSLNPRSRK